MYGSILSDYMVGHPAGAATIGSRDTRLQLGAIRHFDRLRGKAQLRQMMSWLRRRSNKLINLNEYSLSIAGSRSAGVRPVCIKDIRGSENRSQDFDDRFNPLGEHVRSRWTSIAVARAQYVELPPVELLCIGRIFFVRDGHHRISVARSRGEETIDANITTIKVDGTFPWESNATHPILEWIRPRNAYNIRIVS